MNDFTKEELLGIYHIIKYEAKLPKSVIDLLCDKIESMIDNYGEQEQYSDLMESIKYLNRRDE